MEKNLIVHHEQFVTSITLNRPHKRNAFNGSLIAELSEVLTQIQNSHRTRVIILQGEGEHFCAGADIAWMQAMSEASETENREDAEKLAHLLYQWHHMPQPTIVLAQGAVRGGGLGLLAAADIVLTEASVSFGFPEVKLNLAPSTISPYVVKAIGERMARYYFLTGEVFNADVAKNMGLIHAVFADTKAMMTAANTLAQQLSAFEPSAIHGIKQLLEINQYRPITKELSQETAKHLADLRMSPEAKTGLKAFLEAQAARGVK